MEVKASVLSSPVGYEISAEDFICRINGPDVALTSVRRGRAGIARQMGGGINKPLGVRKKNPQVVRPFPLFRSFTSLPSTFMLKI